ncbi:MAG: chromate efflux transporter [Acidimicrobiia bacterium]
MVTIAREWGRIGCTGFGGPPAHIALLRTLCVDDRHWLSAREFEDGIAATNLLPGPASTQLAIFCAWRLGGSVGAVLGGLCFIIPGLVLILVLGALFLASSPPLWVQGAAAGAGAAVPAVAVHAAARLMPASWERAEGSTGARTRWVCYLLLGGAAAATVGPYLVLILGACGLTEAIAETHAHPRPPGHAMLFPHSLAVASAAVGGLGALAWVALKVGALSYGGGFVIIPLMQHDAVDAYHWMTNAGFLNAVALGQITPGPVVLTVAVVGYAAAGVGGGVLAACIAFAPSFIFVIGGGPHFDRLRESRGVQAFLTGAGAAAIGAITGAAIPLARALAEPWQFGVLALAAVWLVLLRKNVVVALLASGLLGVVVALAGVPISP